MATRTIVTRIDLRPATEDDDHHHHEDGFHLCCPRDCRHTGSSHSSIVDGNPGADPIPHTSADSPGESSIDH